MTHRSSYHIDATIVVTTIVASTPRSDGDWTMADTSRDVRDHVPLTDLAFHILITLGDGASHGYAIGKEVERRSEGRLNPTTGSLYQALRRLHNDELIAEAQQPKSATGSDSRRQYFRLTPFGKRVFAFEAQRLDNLLAAAREKRLLPKRS
jgi:DNA-binding PadR family transcriptional regulator